MVFEALEERRLLAVVTGLADRAPSPVISSPGGPRLLAEAASFIGPIPVGPTALAAADIGSAPATAATRLQLVDSQGARLDITPDANTIVVGVATWCGASALFKAALLSPEITPQLTGLRIVFAFGNEGGSGPGGVLHPEFLADLPGEVAFLDATSVSPARFPSAFNAATGEFDQHAAVTVGGWLAEHASPTAGASSAASGAASADSGATVGVLPLEVGPSCRNRNVASPASPGATPLDQSATGTAEKLMAATSPGPLALASVLTAGVSGPTSALRGAPQTFALTANDGVSAEFSFAINWGDGSAVQTVTGASGVQVAHAFNAAAAFTISVTATNPNSEVSSPATQGIQVDSLRLVDDPDQPALTNLVWGGTQGDDEVLFEELDYQTIRVTETRLNGTPVNVVQTIVSLNLHRLVAYGQAGNDRLDAQALKSIHATLDGGAGNNTLYGGQAGDKLIGGSNGAEGKQGSNLIVAGSGSNTIYGNAQIGAEGSTGGNNLIIGGLGYDTIYGNYQHVENKAHQAVNGGEGGQNLLVGGGGQDAIYASQESDGAEGGKGSILVSGTTTLSEAALTSVLSEWTSTRSYADRIANISGDGVGLRSNGNHFLDPGVTVFTDPSADQLTGNTNGAQDWFLYSFADDTAQRVKPGETQTDTPLSNALAPAAFEITGPGHEVDHDDILIQWQPSAGATSYQVVLSYNADLSSPFYTSVVGGTEKAVNDLFIYNATTVIYVGVFASNAHGVTLAGNAAYQIVATLPDLRQTLFVTDQLYGIDDIESIPPPTSYFGSAAAADYQCTREAYEAGLLAEPWDGETIYYKALIAGLLDNLAARAGLGDLGFINVLGQEIAVDRAQLLSGDFSAPILTQTGQMVTSDPLVWTGANADGSPSGFNAVNWHDPINTATVGKVTGTGSEWLSYSTYASWLAARLYCLGN